MQSSEVCTFLVTDIAGSSSMWEQDPRRDWAGAEPWGEPRARRWADRQTLHLRSSAVLARSTSPTGPRLPRMSDAIELFPFRYRDPRIVKWVKPRYGRRTCAPGAPPHTLPLSCVDTGRLAHVLTFACPAAPRRMRHGRPSRGPRWSGATRDRLAAIGEGRRSTPCRRSAQRRQLQQCSDGAVRRL